MDPNEAYRLLGLAMSDLRSLLDDAPEEIGPRVEVKQAVEHWEALDGWMRQSGFPPVAWNNPAGQTDYRRVAQNELAKMQDTVIEGRHTPIRREGDPR